MEWEKIGKFLNENIGIISCAVTLFGLYLNNRNLKKNFQNDLKKLHYEIFLNRMSGLPSNIINLMIHISELAYDKLQISEVRAEFEKVQNEIIIYGSTESVNLCCYIQQNMHKDGDNTKFIAAICLLICQLKYDLFGEIISYESWLKINVYDYPNKSEDEIFEYVKEISNKYKLNKKFLEKIPN